MNIIDQIESRYLRMDVPQFRAGDTLRVYVRIREGEKERLQAYEGVCISYSKGGSRASFTVRKISYGVGVERTFPLHSPMLDRIEVLSRGRIRRAKLYYLRKLRGKAARIRELRPGGVRSKKKK